MQEVDDKLILYGFIAGFTLNAILATQVLYYLKSPAKPKKAARPQVVEKVAIPQKSSVSPKPTAKTPTTRRRG